VLWHCWLGDRKDIRPVKSWVLVCWWWWFDWSFARLIAPVVTISIIILSSNKIQNGDILVPANPGPPGQRPLKRERERERESLAGICSGCLVVNDVRAMSQYEPRSRLTEPAGHAPLTAHARYQQVPVSRRALVVACDWSEVAVALPVCRPMRCRHC